MSRIVNEAAMAVLSVLAVVIIGFYYSNEFLLSITFVIVLALILVQKIYVDDEIAVERKKRAEMSALVSSRLDSISKSAESIEKSLRFSTGHEAKPHLSVNKKDYCLGQEIAAAEAAVSELKEKARSVFSSAQKK